MSTVCCGHGSFTNDFHSQPRTTKATLKQVAIDAGLTATRAQAYADAYVDKADAVDALLTQKEIPVTKTKAIGCGIKWKKG